ncbi:hypothetical protein V7087_00725 [Neobacillus niacini]|uniref:hypothetical protein n=1 Tax=Neobacillus niacini TaxID=86668 RepID=UPI002FFF0621
MAGQEQYETESAYPLLPHERVWRPRDLMLVSISTSVATWCFLMGGFVGNYLNAKMGIASLIAGSMIGMLLISLAVIPATAKYGIESVTSTKPFFGNRGWVLSLILQQLWMQSPYHPQVIYYGITLQGSKLALCGWDC